MTVTNEHDELERYVLGMLPDAARDAIEARLLIDTPLFEALCIVENELAYDYALGLLSGEQRRRFEERFLHRPAIEARVRTAAAMLNGIRATEPAERTTGNRWWLYVAAAASIVLIAWLALDNARLRQVAQSESHVASASPNPVAPGPEPTAETPVAPTTPATSQTADSTARVIAVTLQPGIVRAADGPTRVVLPTGAMLRLQLDPPPSAERFAAYRASIRNPDDVEQWSGSAVALPAGAVTISVPAASLPPNDYEILLFGVRAAGTTDEIASYAVSIARQ